MKLIRKLLLATVFLVGLPALANDVKLRLGHVGASGSTYDRVAVQFAEKVREFSGSQIAVEPIGNGVLGSQPQLLSQVAAGTLDFMIIDPSAMGLAKEGRELQVLFAPFLFRDQAHFRKFIASDLFAQLMAPAEKGLRVKHLGLLTDLSPRALSSNKPVRTVGDLKGLKMRVPELPVLLAMWKDWGTSPVPVKATDLFQALQSGMVDGQENGLNIVLEMSFSEVQKYFIPIDYVRSGISLFMSEASWNKLNEQQRAVLRKAVAAVDAQSQTIFPKYEAELQAKAKAAGMQVLTPDLATFRAAANESLKNGRFYRPS